MISSAARTIRRLSHVTKETVEHPSASSLGVYRAYCILAGILVTGFWLAYYFASDDYVDPLWIRLSITGVCAGLVAASYRFESVAAAFDRWVFGLFCLLGLWFVALSAVNEFATDYAVGLLFVVAAISLALSLAAGPRSRLIVFQVFMTVALAVAIAFGRQGPASQVVLFFCVVGIAVVTGVGATVRSRLEKARADYREGLNKADRRAEELLHLKAAFLNNMNHEIRTPLTGILGYAEIIAENADPEYREFARVIRSSGQRLMETLSTILDLASLEAGEFDLAPGRVDLDRAVEDVVNLLRSAADQRGLRIDVQSADVPVVARGDQAAVRRVVYNILSNAVKFTPRGSIRVRSYYTNGSACVQVVDTGIGIEPQFVPNLFREFRQASSGLDRTHEGTGLGLAISKRLANLMDGHISVESKPGEGSTFTLSLPVYLSHLTTVAA